jgi:hypothetical protein
MMIQTPGKTTRMATRLLKRVKILSIFAVLLAAIGQAAFAQSAESDFETAPDGVYGGITITKYVGWDTAIRIPAAIGGKPVTTIGQGAFAKMNLTEVTIPEGVKSIAGGTVLSDGRVQNGEGAFAGNKLTAITIPGSVETIGVRAFYDNSLAALTIPAGVTSIGAWAFSYNLLARITVSGSAVMGGYAFARNRQLTSVTLGANCVFDYSAFIEEDDLGKWNSKGNIGERGTNLHYDYFCNDRKAGTYTVDLKYREPKESGEFKYVETRYGAAITNYTGSATAVRIPEKVGSLTVKYIGNQMTYTITWYTSKEGHPIASNIERVLIPDTVTAIGDKAFYRYDGSKKLTSVTIGKGVTYIGNSAFGNNTLTSVVIPDSVTYIGDRAFYDTKLTSVTIGANVSVVDGSYSSSLPCANYYNKNGKKAGMYEYFGTETIKGWRVLYDGFAFSNGTIEYYSGSETALVIPSLIDGRPVTSIGKKAFYNKGLTSVTIPDSVTTIGDSAFYGNKLTSVVIPDSVTTIGDSAFYGNQLMSVVIPDSVTTIGIRAFDNNRSTIAVETKRDRETREAREAQEAQVKRRQEAEKENLQRAIDTAKALKMRLMPIYNVAYRRDTPNNQQFNEFLAIYQDYIAAKNNYESLGHMSSREPDLGRYYTELADYVWKIRGALDGNQKKEFEAKFR